MTQKTKKHNSFANGFDYFCADCGRFFSVRAGTVIAGDTGGEEDALYCPWCGDSATFSGIAELIDYCLDEDTDTVNFYSAFPPDEKIPHSRTRATPKQVEWIVGCVISDRRRKLPVTVCSIADALGYDRRVVEAVFDELHL